MKSISQTNIYQFDKEQKYFSHFYHFYHQSFWENRQRNKNILSFFNIHYTYQTFYLFSQHLNFNNSSELLKIGHIIPKIKNLKRRHIRIPINIISQQTMIASKIKDKNNPKLLQPKEESEPHLRRSSRVIKVKCDDDFLIGHDQLDLYIGRDPSQDDHGAKRPRRSYYYDDFSDFSDNRRPYKKKYRGSQNMRRCPPMNSVQGLLKWRGEMRNNLIPEPTKDNSQVIKIKNICKENLEKHGQGIQALFINIQWNKKNQKFEDVKNLRIQSTKLMPKGLVFIWTPKELISQIIQLMQRKGFNYVQNLQIGIFDRQKAFEIFRKKKGITQKIPQQTQANNLPNKKKDGKKLQRDISTQFQQEQFIFQQVVSCLQNVNPSQLIHASPSQYFNRSKKTLYIFRRDTEQKLELRHQRTCDVVFDMPKNPNGKCELELKNYLFLMIETMLPKCLEFDKSLKMMELWGDVQMRRRGWITIVQQ